MCTNFRTNPFRAYVLPSLPYGSQCLDAASLRLLDKKPRQFGCRLLMWPRGAPGAVVVGELGWPPMSIEARRLQLSLFGRLSAAGSTDDGRTLASRVFNYAVHSSWLEAGALSHRSSCKTSCAAGSTPTKTNVSKGRSNSELARALCATTAMMPL